MASIAPLAGSSHDARIGALGLSLSSTRNIIMTLTLNLAEKDEQRLTEKARAAGVDVQTYVERIVRAAACRPALDEALRPVREAFQKSGMTDNELGDLLEDAKHKMRAVRRNQSHS